MVLRMNPARGLCRPKRVTSDENLDSSNNEMDLVQCPSVIREVVRKDSKVSEP